MAIQNSLRVILLATFFLVAIIAPAQDNFLKDYAPTAPNAASLGKFGDIPVSNHTGVPDISIPIHTLTEGSLSIPVSVSYHSSGIRVEETPSWVGLGWALNAGGMITRSVQHTPDEGSQVNQVTGYYRNFGHNMDFVSIGGNCQDLAFSAQGFYDTEPDLFSFSINGYTGKFFFDKTRTLHLIPYQDLKIEPYIETNGAVIIKGFILIDPQGVRYHFGATDASMNLADYLELSSSINLADVSGTLGNELPSSWYLSKIESADRKDLITFNYVTEKYAFFSPGNKTTFGLANTCPSSDLTPIQPIKTSINGKRLASITGLNSSIVFTGDPTPRQDLSLYGNTPYSTSPNNEAKSLKTIEIRDKSNNCLRKFDFSYSYVTAPVGSLPPASIPADNIDRIRLTLNSITEAACNTSTNSKTHTFEYYDLNLLPRRCSFSVDHWGYNNGKANATLMPGYPYTKTGYNDPCYFIGGYCPTNTGTIADRESAFPEMRHGTLKKITYPTGGSSSFEYEAHTARVSQETCTDGIVNVFNAVPPNCIDAGSDYRTYNFTQFQIDNGYLKLEMTLNAGCSGGAIELEIFVGPNPWGTPVYWTFLQVPSGNNTVTQTLQLDNLGLAAGSNYTFLMTAIGGISTATVGYQSTSFVESNKIVGGLRVKKITTADGLTANNIIKNFEYNVFTDASKTSGVLLYMPLYTSNMSTWKGNLAGITNINCELHGTTPFTCQSMPFVSFSTIGINPMHSGLGSHIGYTNVSVYETGNGKTRYSYELGSSSAFPLTSYPFAQPTFNPRFGQLMKEEYFRETGEKVLEKAYTYNFNAITLTQGQDIVKSAYVPVGLNCGGSYATEYIIPYTIYSLISGYSLLSGISEKVYNVGTSTFFEKNTAITYSVANGHYQKTTEDVTNSDGTVYRTKFKYALDFPCPTTGTFCDETNTTAVPAAKVILAMRKRNMVAIPIEQTTWLKKTSWGAFRLTNATFFSFGTVGGNYNHIKLDSILQIRPATPLTSFSESAITGTGGFTPASGYVREYNFVYSPTHGKLLSQWKQNDPAKQQYIWGHNQKLPIAKIINAEANEVAFTSFEEPNNSISQGNWSLTGSAGGWSSASGDFVTGRIGFNLSPARTCTLAQVPAGKYIVSCWHKNGSIVVNGTTISTTGATWKLAETEITLSNPTNTVTVSCGASDWLQMIDELRISPSDALMSSISYDDQNQLLLSMADENNVAAHYEYDNFQRLQGVRDQDRNLLQTMEYNYRPGGGVLNDIKARTVLIAGQTTLAQVQALTGGNVRYLAQYFDGLARPVQTNAVGQSPAQNDIISFQQYDQYGRENKQYLPYTIATNGGAYRTGFATEQSTFINGFGAGGYGYSETAFEPSALNRATAQSAPGAVWRLGTVTPRYQRTFWRANTVADAVRDFTNNTTFAANTLWMTESVDENGRSRFVFTDKMGRTVLVKQPLNATETAQTYTVYDDFGRVTCVIPPETTKRMVNSSNWDWTSATYAGMVFKYAFDARGRMVAKTIPSTGTTTIAYDRLDRNVLTTDANGVKLYTRYDILSRPVASGRYVGAATAPSGTEPLFETANTTAPHFYSTNTFPTDVANTHIYKIFYYDDYDFNHDGLIGAGETYTNPGESGYDAVAFLRTRGKPTAVKTAILPNTLTAPSTYLSTRTYYDKEYSVIQVNKQNHLGGSDIVHNYYDFANRLTKTRRDHTGTPPGGTLKTYTIREEYVLDHAGRIRFVRHHLGTSTTVPTSGWVVTSAPLYDELGRVVDKRLHASNYNGSSAVTLTSSFSYLQSLDFSYNIRGWLTGINNVASCAVQAGDNLADVFSMKLDYDAPTGGGTAQFNGNISNMQWRTYIGTTCLNQQQYRFSYDYANRLTAADHYTNNGTSWLFTNNYTENNISYDLNGNLKTYTRRGQTPSTGFDVIDQLSYTYGDAARPDRLTQMSDVAPLSVRVKGFAPSTSAITGDHYIYDASGNMTQDKHKGFTIQYNYLNLPIVFTKGSNVITMTYTADGEKLSKAVTGGGAAKNYTGGIEYSGANLEAIYFSEGRCLPNGATAFFYDYTVKDHLGNARVNFRASGTSIVNIEDHHYYPFGMKMEGIGSSTVANKYTYNGKELNDDFGLNLHDYGARWYDAALGRWWSVDPLAEEYVDWSGYNYVKNNPLRLLDPDGMSVTGDIYNLNGVHIGNDGEDDNKVYLAKTNSNTQLTIEQSKILTEIAAMELYGNPIGRNTIIELPVKHSTFLEMAGWAYNENLTNADAQKATLGVLMNWTKAKKTYHGFDNINTLEDALNTVYSHTGGKESKLLTNQRNFINSTPKARNENTGMTTATAAAIHVLTGGRDYSNGALQEHGQDFFTKGWPMYKSQQAQGYTWAANGIFNGYYTEKTHPSHIGSVSGGYKYIITASYGRNIFATFSDKYKKK